MPKLLPRRGIAALVSVIAIALSLTDGPALAQSTVDQGACASIDQGSTAGYPDASAAEAKDLFTQHFPCILDSLAADPPAAKTYPNGFGDGANSSTPPLPLRTSDGSAVDLTLEPEGSGYAPTNPLVNLSLPADLGHEVSVGDRGIALDMGATDAEAAGTATADPLAGEGVFYADAARSSDILLAPTSTGLETVYQLRAPQSPERLTMGFTLPAGASVERAVDGGAQVVQDGQAVANVYAPQAIDAEGNPVPSTMAVSRGSVNLDVPHSDPSIAYPIAVTASAGSFLPAASAQTATVTPGMNGVGGLAFQNPGAEPAKAAELGVGAVRYWVNWCDLQPDSAGSYRRSALQGVVNAATNAKAAGMQLLVEFTTSAPQWAKASGAPNGCGNPAPDPSHAADYGAAMRKIAWCLNDDSRCNNNVVGGTVDTNERFLSEGWVYGLEAGNEPNIETFWNDGGVINRSDANAYYALLQQAASQLHTYATNVGITINVSGAGLSFGNPNGHTWGDSKVDAITYLDQLLSNGNSGADAYSIHPYGPGIHPNMVYSNGVG